MRNVPRRKTDVKDSERICQLVQHGLVRPTFVLPPANAQLRILVHEAVHALGVGYAEYGRTRANVIVDTATYLAAASVGLDVSGESILYGAAWGETGALKAVIEFASTIDKLARRIEPAPAVLAPPSAAA